MPSQFINGPQIANGDSTGSAMPTKRTILLQLVAQRDEISRKIEAAAANFSWRELADMGLVVEAIKRYRREAGCESLTIAKRAIDLYRECNGHG